MHHVSLHVVCSSHKHLCVYASTATSRSSKHDTIQQGLQAWFFLGAGVREQLVVVVVVGAGRTLGKSLGTLSAGGERKSQADELQEAVVCQGVRQAGCVHGSTSEPAPKPSPASSTLPLPVTHQISPHSPSPAQVWAQKSSSRTIQLPPFPLPGLSDQSGVAKALLTGMKS